MKILIDKSFEKDVSKIDNKQILGKIADCLEKFQNVSSLKEIKSIKKLKGFDKEYRIKIGDYRLGIIVENNVVEFIRCLHRKDIYKFFP